VRAALGHLLSMLRKTGKIAPKATPTPGPIDKLVEAFLAHSRQCRGVGVLTCYQQGAYVRQFLVARFGAGPIDLPAITARDVKDFVVRRAEQGHLRTAKLAGTGLRCFLRFLAFQQLCDPLLVQAVPSVVHRFRRISPTLTEEQLRRLLDWFDRTTAIGRRDHAMALCMASLGLRVGEVVQLRLEEVDWRVGTLCVSAGKRRRPAVLPLPSGLGEALGEYIRVARPVTTQRRIFVTHAVPVGRALSAHGAAAAIRRAWEHVDPNGATRGTHVIRHTVATRMVCEGASLKEVADVLRHHDLDTTVVYAKVDLPKLKKVALPWPEVH
jgi:site-specific recombinase XerD